MAFKSTQVEDFIEFDEAEIKAAACFWKSGVHDPDRLPLAPVRASSSLHRDVATLWSIVTQTREELQGEKRQEEWCTLAALLGEGDLSVQNAWLLWKAFVPKHPRGRHGVIGAEMLLKTFSSLPDAFEPSVVLEDATLAEQLGAFYTSWQHTRTNVFGSLAPLCGLLSILIGPLDAWRLWCKVIPRRERGPILDWIHIDPKHEERLARQVQQEREATQWPPSGDVSYWLSSLVRYPDDALMEELVERIDAYTLGAYEHSRWVYQQLGGVEPLFFEQYTRKIVRHPDQVVLDLYVNERLDLLREDVLVEWFKLYRKQVAEVFESFSKVHSVHMAHAMFSCYDEPYIGKLAQGWLLEEGANAIAAATELLERGKSKKRDRAVEVLRRYRDMGAMDLLVSASAQCSDRARTRLEKEVIAHHSAEQSSIEQGELPEWLVALSKDARFLRKRLPSLIQLEALPPLRIRGSEHVVQDATQELLIHVLRESTPEEPAKELALFREWLEPTSAAKWSLALCELWLRDRAKGSHKWMLFALAALGDDSSAQWLGKSLKRWKGARAGWGVDTLAAMNRDAAWRELFSFTTISRESLRKEKSVAYIAAMAARRGYPLHVFEDSIQPDCDLDASGKRTFSYGDRAFVLELDDTLEPHFWDAQKNCYIKTLPRGARSDDARAVERARNAYARDRELLRKTIRKEVERLESRMLRRVVWPASLWRTAMLEHPLLLNFAKRLLWFGEIVSEDGVREHAAFRVTQELSLANIEDEVVSILEDTDVVLLHPAQLDTHERTAWSQILIDYEVIQPFDQLEERTRHVAELPIEWTECIPPSWLGATVEVNFESLVFGARTLDWRFCHLSRGSREQHDERMYSVSAMLCAHIELRVAIVCMFGSDGEANYGSRMTFLRMACHALPEDAASLALDEDSVSRLVLTPVLSLAGIDRGLLNEALSDLRRMMGFEG